jgi:hypothetical protein
MGKATAVSMVIGRTTMTMVHDAQTRRIRTDRVLGVATATLVVGMAGLSAGCIFTPDVADCSWYPAMSCFDGGAGGHGGDSGPPPGCVPNESVDPVGDACGVFVSSSLGDDGSPGTKAKPLKTIQAALAKGKPVYACGEGFTEAVSIAESVTLYGALSCAKGWVYDAAKKTQLTAGADAIPLTVSKAATSAEVNDFAITAADAMKDGGSSIAVLAAQAAVSFARCDVAAGNGKAGVAGAAFGSAAQAGVDGNAGKDACTASIVVPGGSVTNTCGGGDSTSGSGGIGDVAQGGAGSPGLPLGSMNFGAGDMGSGCGAGSKGDDGAAGTSGTGATGLGTLSASGFAGVSGGDGGPGAVAQGGGGGGGAKGETTASACPSGMGGGASGGSGASGGCGGLGGKGGNAGGASMALVSLDATLTFSSVALKVGSGGKGGDGGAPQAGGAGGMNGGAGGKGKNPLKPGCMGGPGGKGGDGGKGGGGTGGHAIGIAATGTAPPMTGVTFTKGTAGGGGKGDSANGNMGDGASGVVADVQVFP